MNPGFSTLEANALPLPSRRRHDTMSDYHHNTVDGDHGRDREEHFVKTIELLLRVEEKMPLHFLSIWVSYQCLL